jgi:hypothetical protein
MDFVLIVLGAGLTVLTAFLITHRLAKPLGPEERREAAVIEGRIEARRRRARERRVRAANGRVAWIR